MKLRTACQARLFAVCVLEMAAAVSLLAGSGTSEGVLAYVHRVPTIENRSWLGSQIANYRSYPRLDLAFRLMKQGRMAAAEAELDALLAREPNDLAAHSVEMVLFAQNKDHDKVIRQAGVILTTYPSFGPALMYRGLARQALGQTQAALQDLASFVAIGDLVDADRIAGLDKLIDLAIAAKQYDKALNAIERLAVLKKDSHLYYRKGVALQGLGRNEDASLALQTAVNLAVRKSERLDALQALGDIAYKQSDWKTAKKAYELALALSPNKPEILRSAAKTAYQMGNFPEASRRMRQLLSIRPSIEDREYLANVLVSETDYAGAEQEFRQVLKLTADPKQAAPAYRSLIEIARLRKNNRAAIQLLRSLLRMQPDSQGHELLLALLQQEKNYPAMADELERRAALQSGDAGSLYETYTKLGNVYTLARQYDQASAAFRRAMDINRSAPALEALAESLVQAGRTEEAIGFINEAVYLRPSTDLFIKLAVLYARIEKPELSLESLKAALQSHPSPAAAQDIYRQQGYLYAKLGRTEEAQAALGRALDISPGNVELQIAMAEICIERRDYKAAIPYLERAQAAQNSAQIMKMLALSYAGSGNTISAEAEYETLLKQQTHPSAQAEEIRTSLAYLEAQTGNFERSANLLLEAFKNGSSQHPNLLFEAGEKFSLAQNWQQARDVYLRYLHGGGSTSALQAKAWESLGFVYTKLGVQKSAAESFRKALDAGQETETLHRNLAFSYYALGEWSSSLEQFQAALRKERHSQSFIGAARCYQRLDRPGLAIHYLNQALAASDLSESERVTVWTELGYLYYSVQEYASAAKAWGTSLGMKSKPLLWIQTARAHRLVGDLTSASAALHQIHPQELSGQEKIGYLDETAAVAKQQGDRQASIRAFNEANKMAPAAWRDYELGTNEMEEKNYSVGISHFRHALAKEPGNTLYIRALAYAFEKAGRLQDAARMFEELARHEPKNTSWFKSLAYVNMQLARNAESAAWFRKAIDNYYDLESGGNESSRDTYLMRSEVTRLTKSYDFTLYQGFVSSSYARPGAPDLFGSSPFPSSAGIEAAYRPPVIGMRNGRTLEMFARLLWSNDHNMIGFDTKLYQLSAGVRYKPFRKQNLWISGEKLVHTGRATYRGWLIRGLYSWNPGFEVKPNKRSWNHTLVFSDTAYLPFGLRTFAQYGEARRGITFNFQNKLLVTPLAIADVRWQLPSLYAGTYAEAGGGISFRYLYNANRYEAQRSSFEVLVQCKRGRVSSPAASATYVGCSATSIFRF